jgi:hypothetical protein
MAAYFFIIGRYGVKVSERITVASVTGGGANYKKCATPF